MTYYDEEKDLRRFLALIRNNLKIIGNDTQLAMDADLDAMGLDSVSALNLMLDLEEAYEVVFTEAMFTEETFATPNSLWNGLLTLRRQ